MSESNKSLKKSAQSVQDALSSKGLTFKVIELSASTRTANDAAETISCEVAQIVKSLVFRTKTSNKLVLILEFGYGDLYARSGLSDKHRELAVIACLIGQGNTGLPLKTHLKGMLNVGWTKNEIIELLIFLIGYVGFPSCVDAIITFQQIIEDTKS